MMKCDKKWLGYYQSCDSCEGYVTCVWGHKYDRKCPGGLKWNDDHKGCDRTTPTCTEKNWIEKRIINYNKIHHAFLFYVHKMEWKIRTDNTMANRKKTIGQAMISKTTQKTKDRATRTTLITGGWTQVLRKSKPFLFHIRHPSCYQCQICVGFRDEENLCRFFIVHFCLAHWRSRYLEEGWDPVMSLCPS
jgi:hypothetical protein